MTDGIESWGRDILCAALGSASVYTKTETMRMQDFLNRKLMQIFHEEQGGR